MRLKDPRPLLPGAAIRTHPYCVQRKAVGIGAAITDLRIKGILRCRMIEFLKRKATLPVGELIHRPPALDHEPLSGRKSGGVLRDDGQRLLARIHAVDSRLLMPALHGADVMHVIVNKSGNDGAAIQIHDLRVRIGQRGHVVVGAGRENPVAVKCNGLDDIEFLVDGENPAVVQDSVRRPSRPQFRWCCHRWRTKPMSDSKSSQQRKVSISSLIPRRKKTLKEY